jgi:hypothetical protein
MLRRVVWCWLPMFRGKLSIPSSRFKRVKQCKQKFPPKWRYLSTRCHMPRASHLKVHNLSVHWQQRNWYIASTVQLTASLSLLLSTGRLLPIFVQRTIGFSFGYQEQSLALCSAFFVAIATSRTIYDYVHATQKTDVFLFEKLLH